MMLSEWVSDVSWRREKNEKKSEKAKNFMSSDETLTRHRSERVNLWCSYRTDDDDRLMLIE
jgi:hypothetical protein